MLKTIIKVALVTLPVTYTTFDNIGYICRVEGNSMKPLITPSKNYTNYIFLSRLGYQSFELNRGEVVCLICPTNPKQRILKRIIGLEGDTIKTRNYKEEYVRVGKGHCWIEGDNHDNSLDSNTFGTVPIGLVQSKATHLIWPKFSKIPTLDVISRIKSHMETSDITETNFQLKNKQKFFIKSVKSGRTSRKEDNDDDDDDDDDDDGGRLERNKTGRFEGHDNKMSKEDVSESDYQNRMDGSGEVEFFTKERKEKLTKQKMWEDGSKNYCVDTQAHNEKDKK